MFDSARDVLERTEDTRAGRIGLGPMTSKVVGPVSSTEKSCYYNALIDFEGITARGGAERVRGGEGQRWKKYFCFCEPHLCTNYFL